MELAEKTCPLCGLVKPVTEFTPRGKGHKGYQPMCKPCRSLYNRGYNQIAPADRRGLARRIRDMLRREQQVGGL